MPVISFSCVRCGKKLKAPETAAGKTLECPACHKMIRVPAPGQNVPEPPAWSKAETYTGILRRLREGLPFPRRNRGLPPPSETNQSIQIPERIHPTGQNPGLPAVSVENPGRVSIEIKPSISIYDRSSDRGVTSGNGTLIGGGLCLLIGAVTMILSPWLFLVYVPFFLASFILAIIAASQSRPFHGVLLMLLILFTIGGVCIYHAAKNAERILAATTPGMAEPTKPAPAPEKSKVVASDPVAPHPIPTLPQVPVVRIGDSVTIDEMRIEVKGVTIGHIETENPFNLHDRKATKSEERYLLAHIGLENVSEGRITYLQSLWQKTKIVDNCGNIEGAKFTDGLRLHRVFGTIDAAKLKPGEKATDMIIFDLPVDAAKEFTIESCPGFWRSVEEDRVKKISGSTFKVQFTRDQIQP